MEVGPGEGRDLLQALEGKPHHASLAVSWQKSANQVLGSMLVILGLWSPEAEAGGSELRDFITQRVSDQSEYKESETF